jgi:hypothetical protein
MNKPAIVPQNQVHQIPDLEAVKAFLVRMIDKRLLDDRAVEQLGSQVAGNYRSEYFPNVVGAINRKKSSPIRNS